MVIFELLTKSEFLTIVHYKNCIEYTVKTENLLSLGNKILFKNYIKLNSNLPSIVLENIIKLLAINENNATEKQINELVNLLDKNTISYWDNLYIKQKINDYNKLENDICEEIKAEEKILEINLKLKELEIKKLHMEKQNKCEILENEFYKIMYRKERLKERLIKENEPRER